ncbi:MAG: hypothetical protein HY866_14285 [Chloroflexi bacterium]|nr:hypothetical protein [Chloroflexota bacterium]
MKHSRLILCSLIALLFALTACGGQTREGVTLQPVKVEQSSSTTIMVTSTPEPKFSGLSGRLIYLKGTQFESLDLASGQTFTFESSAALSQLILNSNKTHGVFAGQSRFMVINLLDNTVFETQNLGTNAGNMRVSPDGNWIGVTIGQISARILMISLPALELHTVTGRSGGEYDWSWTTDSRMVWWDYAAEAEPMVYDPASGESTPVGSEEVSLTVPFPLQLSPDGQHIASVRVAYGPQPGQDVNAESCFDSYVELFDSTYTTNSFNTRGEVMWTEDGLVASSPQWLNKDQLMFVKVGNGFCGTVDGEEVRQLMLLDITASGARPRILVEHLGNGDDVQDRMQRYGKLYGHLYSPSPDGKYFAWINGSMDEGITEINITEINTGETETIMHLEYGDARDAVDFIENYFIRQVIWLE